MKLENLKMPGFSTSLVGVVKGVLDYYGAGLSDAMVFGGSGHAFLINVHDQICPSGPYCWNPEWFFGLLKNLGLETVDLGFYGGNSTTSERNKVEQMVKKYLDDGVPCSVVNMDNQIVVGHDEKGLLLAQPWCADVDTTPSILTYGKWSEFGSELHVSFLGYKRTVPKDRSTIVRGSVDAAIDLFKNPSKYSWERYQVGLGAYDNWAAAVEKGHGSSHGNWWNGMVWSECRRQAASYISEVAADMPGATALAGTLSSTYAEISEGLKAISDKEMDKKKKIDMIQTLKAKEGTALGQLEEWRHHLGGKRQ